jgi:hypothetical protein
MADDLAGVWRNAVDANVRYWDAWGRIANDYVRELGDTLRGCAPLLRLPAWSVPAPMTAAARESRPAVVVPEAHPSALVLEAAAGAVASGAVLVENHLPHPVTAAVEPRFDLPEGDDVSVEVVPRTVELAPGESSVVRIKAVIPLEGPRDVRGELLVPQLAGTSVSLVIRRIGEPGTGD